jgi:hypothetical protein
MLSTAISGICTLCEKSKVEPNSLAAGMSLQAYRKSFALQLGPIFRLASNVALAAVSVLVSRIASITRLPAESKTAAQIVAWCTS